MSEKNLKLKISSDAFQTFCRRWKILELSLFGSVLTDNFRSESDVDILVLFDKSAKWGLLDHERLRLELTDIFGRTVDLVSKRAIEKSQNQIRKREILGSARVYYVA